jgi:hypothetical protein
MSGATCRVLWDFSDYLNRAAGDWTVQVLIDGAPALTKTFVVAAD